MVLPPSQTDFALAGRGTGDMAEDLQWRAIARVLAAFIATAGATLPVALWAQNGKIQDQIAQHEQALAVATAAHQFSVEALELNILGDLYRRGGKPEKGVDALNQALAIEQRGQNALALA